LASKQGGHELLDLHTNRTITHHKVTELPITKNITAAVKAITKQEGIPTGLKVETKAGTVLCN